MKDAPHGAASNQLVQAFLPHAEAVKLARKELMELYARMEGMQRAVDKASSAILQAASQVELEPSRSKSMAPFCSTTSLFEPLTLALKEEIQKLDSQIEEHKAVKLMVTELDKRQVEYDHYVDKLRNMSSAPGDRLAANEHKRKVAQEHLDSCTSSLTTALEKTLEAAPVNMATLMAAVFAAEGKATLASNAAFGEMLEEPPQWMGVVANKHPEMAETIATAGSIASAAVGAPPHLNAEVGRLRDQNKQLKEDLANLQGTRGNGTTTPTSDSSPPQRAAMPAPAQSSPVQDLLDLGDLLGAPPASSPSPSLAGNSPQVSPPPTAAPLPALMGGLTLAPPPAAPYAAVDPFASMVMANSGAADPFAPMVPPPSAAAAAAPSPFGTSPPPPSFSNPFVAAPPPPPPVDAANPFGDVSSNPFAGPDPFAAPPLKMHTPPPDTDYNPFR